MLLVITLLFHYVTDRHGRPVSINSEYVTSPESVLVRMDGLLQKQNEPLTD